MLARGTVLLASFALVVLLIAAPAQAAAPPVLLHVSFINVGQGDAILLHDDNNFDVLIDGGIPSAGQTVLAYLRQQQIDDIDVMVATHADSDHVGGLVSVLNATDIPVETVFYNGYPGSTATWNNFVTAVSQEGLTLTPLQYPGTRTWGSTSITVLNPRSGLSSPDQNDASVVLMIIHGNTRFLFTGDIGSSVEASILAYGIPLSAPILKTAHHGSQYSSSASFLSAVAPRDAIISVGTNSYGHPAPETLTRLDNAGAQIWRTDISGTIVVTDNGTNYTLSTTASYSLFLPVIQHVTSPGVLLRP